MTIQGKAFQRRGFQDSQKAVMLLVIVLALLGGVFLFDKNSEMFNPPSQEFAPAVGLPRVIAPLAGDAKQSLQKAMEADDREEMKRLIGEALGRVQEIEAALRREPVPESGDG